MIIIALCYLSKWNSICFCLRENWGGGLVSNCFLITGQNFHNDLLFFFQLRQWLHQDGHTKCNIMRGYYSFHNPLSDVWGFLE